MAIRRTRATTAQHVTGNASLRITCKDGQGEPISAAARVLVADSAEGTRWAAKGKDGVVSTFQFGVPPGRYSIDVEAEGYKRLQDSVTVTGGSQVVKDVRLAITDEAEDDKDAKGEKHLVDGRFTRFLALRSPGTLRKRNPAPFPVHARTFALQHARRMIAASAEAPGLPVKRIDDPAPRSSFGSVDAFVEVRGGRRSKPFTPTMLTIPFDLHRARGIDLSTLRMFRIDPKDRTFKIVEGCMPDLQLKAVQGMIDQPGIYGIYGLPVSPAIRRTIDLICTFKDKIVAERSAGIDTLQRQICELILCAGGIDGTGGFTGAGAAGGLGNADGLGGFGGFSGGGNICDQCIGLDFGPSGPPECQIVPGPVITPGCNWTCIGPRNINGRVRSLAIHPTDGNILITGTGTGGVWLTRDSGQSWKPLMQDEASLAIGAVAVQLTDPGNPAGDFTIYAGTGEPTWWPGYAGVGVLKSTNSGVTWTTTGALPSPGNVGFSSILIDPSTVTNNPATTTVYATGTPGGLYRSTDGGATWTLLRTGSIQNVVFDPVVAGGLYVAEAFAGIFRYDPNTNSWSAFNAGLASSPQLILIAIGKTAPNTMYAKLDDTVYRYDTGTSTWVSLGSHGGTTYGYWNNVLEVDPQDSNIVIAGGISLERTYDGGTTWQAIGGLHADQHAAAFDSTNHLTIYAGNDGGVYRGTYTTASSVGVWAKTSDGLIVTEFNDVGTSLGTYDMVGGGAQDNGTSRTTGGLTWDFIAGADGGYYVVDPTDAHIQYAESQNGGLMKSTNGGASFGGSGTGFSGGPWVTPILIDPNSPAEPNRVLFAGGSTQVYRSTNSAGSWSASSPSLGGPVLSLALAPSSSAIVYAGSGGGHVWRSSDNGATIGNWADITVGAVGGSATLPARAVTDIVVHPTDPNTLFVTFSGFDTSTPTTPGHVFRGVSTDGGVTWLWTDITSNLPDIPANAIELLTSSPTTLYVGTDAGVYRTTNGGTTWGPFGNGLPSVIVSDLALDDSGTLLRAATYGRGMWQTRLASTCAEQDVYIRDSKLDTSELFPSPSGVSDPTVVGGTVYWWQSPDIKVDAYPYVAVDALFDGVEFDTATAEDPVRNDAAHPNGNRLYVQVHNRGPRAAHNVKVKVLYADASAGLPLLPSDFWASYPNDWSTASTWNTVNPAVPFQTIATLDPHTPVVLRWDWNVPTSAADHTCMLAVISSDEDPVMRSDAVLADRQLWDLVPNDKHVGLRNLHVVTGTAPFGGAPLPLFTWLNLHNPFEYTQFFDLVIDRGALPRDAELVLLLPDVMTRHDLKKVVGKGVRVQSVRERGWWGAALKTVGKHAFRSAVTIGHPDDDDCDRHRVVPGMLLHPGKPLRVGVVIRQSRSAKPGNKSMFSLLQRVGDRIMGGSTFELRIPPVVVTGERSERTYKRR
jgi:hypothetical protein